jgi:hypothetical protein
MFCDGLISRPEESYRVSNCMCDHRNPERGPMFQDGKDRKANERMNESYMLEPIIISYVYQFLWHFRDVTVDRYVNVCYYNHITWVKENIV